MADILIRGMEMPQRCKACLFCGFGGRRSELNVCMFTGESQPKLSQERMSKCPLVPVPPHGRLIDADALAAQFQKLIVNEDDLMELCKRAGLMSNYYNESKVQVGMVTFMRMLYDAKTIVPAEGGADNG